MGDISKVQSIISGDPVRRRLLKAVRSLELPDCWIGAGFVRNAVWDSLHGREASPVSTDVDVIRFDAERSSPSEDGVLQAVLERLEPAVMWSVKNQARMHIQNGDEPYSSAIDAMRYWPETATAVAVRLRADDTCEVAAPLGLDDLLGLIIRPVGKFAVAKSATFRERYTSKKWLEIWPQLKLVSHGPQMRPER